MKKLDLNVTRVAALLTGSVDQYDLEDAFTWADSPQGERFWVRQCDRLERGDPLTPDALAALRVLMADHLGIRAEKISNLLHDFYQEIGARIATNEEKKK